MNRCERGWWFDLFFDSSNSNANYRRLPAMLKRLRRWFIVVSPDYVAISAKLSSTHRPGVCFTFFFPVRWIERVIKNFLKPYLSHGRSHPSCRYSASLFPTINYRITSAIKFSPSRKKNKFFDLALLERIANERQRNTVSFFPSKIFFSVFRFEGVLAREGKRRWSLNRV